MLSGLDEVFHDQRRDRAEAAGEKTREVHVVFNNNKADYAPRAAALFREMVGPEEHTFTEGRARHTKATQRKLEYA